MAPRTSRDELNAAWRALSNTDTSEGWRTIPVAIDGQRKFFAGRYFPGNEEALLIKTGSARLPAADQLPHGRGFTIRHVSSSAADMTGVRIALCRHNLSSIELFTNVACDIITSLNNVNGESDDYVLETFLSRIRAWQEFMRRSPDGLLSIESETGLVGELTFIHELLKANLLISAVVASWRGPLDELHDFVLGNGGIEVKTSTAPQASAATISSLDQLDDSLLRPLFLASIKLALDAAGKSLPELIGETRTLLSPEPRNLTLFDSRLLHAGYLDAVADQYVRRFSHKSTTLFQVNDEFPRLTRRNVHEGVRKACYEIDLSLIRTGERTLAETLNLLGAA